MRLRSGKALLGTLLAGRGSSLVNCVPAITCLALFTGCAVTFHEPYVDAAPTRISHLSLQEASTQREHCAKLCCFLQRGC